MKGEDITYPGGGGEMKGYLVKPADQTGKLGTVIVIHENRGLNPHIHDVARRVALEGFVALAPDFLSPLGGTPADEDKARDMFAKLDPAQTVANAVATVAFLEGRQGRQRQGRRHRLLLGRRHGQQAGRQRARSHRRRRLLRHAAEGRGRAEDQGGAAAALCRARRAHQCRHRRLQEGARGGRHVEYTVYVYDGANHAFNNDTSAARYDKKAADLAWGRTIAFLKEKLA